MFYTISLLLMHANRLAYWLGKLVVMAPRKLALCKYFPYFCFCILASFFLSISKVNSRLGIHQLITNDACFSTCNFQQHQRLANGYSLQRDLCSSSDSDSNYYLNNSVQKTNKHKFMIIVIQQNILDTCVIRS